MYEVNVDMIGRNGLVQGEMASYILTHKRLDPGMMRPFIANDGRAYCTVYKGKAYDPKKVSSYQQVPVNYATLRRDEWKELDAAVLEASQIRLGGIADLVSNNLVYNLGNAMGTTVLEWHDISGSMEALVTMDGVTRAPGNRPKYQTNYLPIPIIHVDYEINSRALEASRKMGNPLDTTDAETAARAVNEQLEAMLFTSYKFSFGEKDDRAENSIYGYLNHPDRNKVTLTYKWDEMEDSTLVSIGEKIVNNVIAMKQASIDDRHYGPWQLYIPTNYETVLDKDYDPTTPGTTIRERIMKIDGIKGIKVIDKLTADNVLLVQMTKDVVRLVRGFGIQSVEWQVEGKFITKYKVMTIQVPQIRSDQNLRSGIVHLAA